MTWCAEDNCPAAICGGPHTLYVDARGNEALVPAGVEPPAGFTLPPDGYVRITDRK